MGGGDVTQRPRPPDHGAGRLHTRRAGDRGGLRHRGEPSRRDNRFALAVLSCTRSEIRLRAGRAAEALADAERAADLLSSTVDPNPYLLAMIVVTEVQALLALGRLDEAARCGQRTVSRLGERVPQARSLILSTVAAALREAGRTEQAYDVLSHSAEVERRAFQELSELQRGLERATLETVAARDQTDALAAKNRELEAVVQRARRRARGARAAHRPARVHPGAAARAGRPRLAHRAPQPALPRARGRPPRRGAGRRPVQPRRARPRRLQGHQRSLRPPGRRPRADARRRAAPGRAARPGRRRAHGRRGVRPPHAAHGRRRGRRRAASGCATRSATSRGTASRRGCGSPPASALATADDASNLLALAELADSRLFEAKRSGRDRVVV